VRQKILWLGVFLTTSGVSLFVIGLLRSNMSTVSSGGQLESGLYSGLALAGVGLIVGIIGMYILLKEWRASTKVLEAEEIGGICRECEESYPVGAKFCMECGEPLKNED
jgi:hypothetical protein